MVKIRPSTHVAQTQAVEARSRRCAARAIEIGMAALHANRTSRTDHFLN
jgi:hypothetical protein